jgi:hypothetical protein
LPILWPPRAIHGVPKPLRGGAYRLAQAFDSPPPNKAMHSRARARSRSFNYILKKKKHCRASRELCGEGEERRGRGGKYNYRVLGLFISFKMLGRGKARFLPRAYVPTSSCERSPVGDILRSRDPVSAARINVISAP